MTIPVSSRIYRILRRLDCYTDQVVAELETRDIQPPEYEKGEEVLGLYKNPGDFALGWIIFTSHKFHFLLKGEEWVSHAYSEIDHVKSVEKSMPSSLSLIMHDGNEVCLDIRGKENNRFFDTFEMQRFFMRVVDDSN